MKLGGVIIEIFSTKEKQQENLEVVYGALEIPLIARLNNEQLPSSDHLLPTLHSLSQSLDGLVIGYNDSEFYVTDENKKLIESFNEYGADIVLGDGYPEGMTFLILRPETLPVMENIRRDQNIPVTRNVFEAIIQTDVNTFDIDNIYPELQLRTLRLSFFSRTIQDRYIIEKFKNLDSIQTLLEEHNGRYKFKTLAKIILANKSILKTVPKYYEFTLTNRGQHENSLFPQTLTHTSPEAFTPTDLSVTTYTTILTKIIEFSKTPVISLGGCGEVTLHPQWIECVELTLAQGISCIVETSGAGLSKPICDRLLAHPHRKHLKMIFKLHGATPAIDAAVTGHEHHFEKRLEIIEYYLLRNPHQSYVEATKVNENIQHLDKFYEYFKRYTSNVLLAKYNPYNGALPERRDDPMKPFHKIDCWHLKRDLYIDETGDVWVCKQDFKKEHTLGNILTDDLEVLFQAGQVYYEKHLNEWDFCKNCDEGYTYNF